MPHRRPEPRYTLLIVPDPGQGEVRQVSVGVAELRRWSVAGAVVLGAILSVAVVGVSAFPRRDDQRQLVEENMALRGRLHDIEGKLQRVEEALGRVQLYDSQLRELLGESPVRPGGSGPYDGHDAAILEEAAQGSLGDTAPPDGLMGDDEDGLVLGDEDGLSMDNHALDVIVPEEDSPALLWATELDDRAGRLLARLSAAEPRLDAMTSRVEDMVLLQASIPHIWPSEGVLTSDFGYRRNPFNRRRWSFHNGLDIAAPKGTPILASAAGTVVTAGWDKGYGRLVEIDHGYGLLTRYGHNSGLNVDVGDWVEAGQVIATMGSTGISTGPHCHFEVRVDGQPVDPLEYVQPTR
ncbi:MAG: hypothetical protein RIT28_4317 [Pseudomonadota bacterium]